MNPCLGDGSAWGRGKGKGREQRREKGRRRGEGEGKTLVSILEGRRTNSS